MDTYPGEHDIGRNGFVGFALILVGAVLGVIGANVYHEAHPRIIERYRAPDKVTVIAPAGGFSANGYDVQLSAARTKELDPLTAQLIAYVRGAPSKEAFGLSCTAHDAKGNLVGAGGFSDLRLNYGTTGALTLVDRVKPVSIKCRLVK